MVFTILNYLKILGTFELLFRPFSLSYPEKMALCRGKKEEEGGDKIYVNKGAGDGIIFYLISLLFAKIIGVDRQC